MHSDIYRQAMLHNINIMLESMMMRMAKCMMIMFCNLYYKEMDKWFNVRHNIPTKQYFKTYI